jgi:hypothetical protein
MGLEMCGSTSMLYSPEKIPVLAKAKEKAPSAAFFGLALLAMAGWIYLLSTIFFEIRVLVHFLKVRSSKRLRPKADNDYIFQWRSAAQTVQQMTKFLALKIMMSTQLRNENTTRARTGRLLWFRS